MNALLELPKVIETGLVPKALSIKITDNATFEAGAMILKDLGAERKEIISQTETVIKQAYDLHKRLKADQNELVKPIEEAERYLRNELGKYEQEQAKIRLEAERKAADERKKAEEEARLKAAAEAEKKGDEAKAEAILNQTYTPIEVVMASVSVPVDTPPVQEKPKGIAFQTVYEINVVDKLAFIRWVASKPDFIHFLNIDETAVKKFATSMQGVLNITGVSVTSKQVAKTTGR